MYISYYDTSGKSDRSIMVTAGLLARSEKKRGWGGFDEVWSVALNGEVPYLHMSEFTNYLRRHPEKADALVFRCIQTIKRQTSKQFVIGLHVNDFNDVDRTYCLHEAYDTHISALVGIAVGKSHAWFSEKYPGTAIKHFHEHGEKGWKRCHDLLKQARIPFDSLTAEDPETGEHLGSFQACDLIAWTYRRLLDQGVSRAAIEHRYAERWYKEMQKHLPLYVGGLGKDELIWLCESSPDIFPRRMR